MFKNREFRVKMVKPDPLESLVDPAVKLEQAKDFVAYTAAAIVSAYASKVVLDLAKEVILLKVTPSR